MNTIEEKLQEHKQFLNRVQAPPELEGRLRNALQNVPAKKRKKNPALTWGISTAAALLLIVGMYEYPAFAYYGGKLLNQSELTSLSFSEVAEQGYGQQVNQSKTLDDGTVITINGVIADDNAFLMYYTINRPAGSVLDDNGFVRYGVDQLHGFLTNSNPTQGNGNYSKDETRFEGVYKFEPVSPFSRTLTATFSERLGNGEQALYPISFKFDPTQAMKSIIKENISKSVPVDQGAVHYDSITASPSSTIVKAHYELKEPPRYPANTKLYVNGTEVKNWGYRGAVGSGFEIEFDVLPTDKIKTIELVLESFPGYQKVKEPVSLAAPSDRSIKIGNEKIWIRSVTKTDTGYDIVIARKQFVHLETDHLSIQAGGNVVPVSSISASRPWDLKNGNILWENTYSFNTTDKPELLMVDGFDYIKTYNKTISVDIKK
ncbi:DUF4179 domain-containing protein [Paenibacillus macerans]|uniref:DUF4179 domain-containing protein n=1 Tax=Paenibacillus macerans TaxID=44252 RepID=A0A090ZR29_PAEMA|nr:DUF4179 domain-containing protein [Paenibacillus macerans]KFN06561.1 hypothetical protein DJ90_4221 [Paenibacillus macerans]MCY7559465.1 DUF4179 domain-containing protein [Paenibacillus macerans]MDU5945738.1 DUF4179 domain-containing protein [Paenibacillus macerans]MEC0137370.1 DUF4179 domain-containing protein [Paenibacillus macerans]MEC0150638.1 DUF4179 domain-containing protein [Paenibacillus macerans]